MWAYQHKVIKLNYLDCFSHIRRREFFCLQYYYIHLHASSDIFITFSKISRFHLGTIWIELNCTNNLHCHQLCNEVAECDCDIPPTYICTVFLLLFLIFNGINSTKVMTGYHCFGAASSFIYTTHLHKYSYTIVTMEIAM